MNALAEYRRKLTERLYGATNDFCSAFEAGNLETAVKVDWTLHQIAAHVRDIHRAVYAGRVRRTSQEQNPLFESVDPDEWMVAYYNKDEPLRKILNEFKTDVDDLCKTLNEIPAEAWSRISRHETIGEDITLQRWVELCLAHVEEHLNAVRKST